MRAGYAAVDVTPPFGTELTGFIAREGPSTGVHDPLFARALAFEDDGKLAAIVALDLIGLGRSLVRRIRARVTARAGVPSEALMLACTHTHGGPETGLLATIARPDPAYLGRLETAVVEVIADAVAALEPVRLAFGDGESRVARNRVYARLGREGPVDSRVGVVRIEAESGRPIASLVSYACHATAAGAGTLLTNSDYPGYLVRALEAATGTSAIFVNGAGADCNPAGLETRGLVEAERTGRALAEDALRAWGGAVRVAGRGVAAASRDVELPLLPLPGPNEAAALLEAGAARLAELPPGSWQRRDVEVTHLRYGAYLTQLHFGRLEVPRVVAEVQAVRVGGLTFVGLPGESFSALGKKAREAAPGPAVVAGWANDVVGYLPDRASFELGGYEFETAHRYYGLPSGFAPEAGERLVEAAGGVAWLSWR